MEKRSESHVLLINNKINNKKIVVAGEYLSLSLKKKERKEAGYINPTYLIACCDCTLINLALKTIVLIFNTTHKMGCCEYCY